MAGPAGNGQAARRVLAVGVPGGITSGFAGLPAGAGLVRLGGTLMSLDEPEYRLWDAALVAPEVPALLGQASQFGIADPGALLDDLADARLVAEFPVRPPGPAALAAGLTASFTGYLIGNGPNESLRFLVRAGGSERQLPVDVIIYQFLLLTDGQAAIAETCGRIDPPAAAGPDVTGHVLAALPVLLRAELIRLDVVRRAGAGES